jgi:hypothetical protein
MAGLHRSLDESGAVRLLDPETWSNNSGSRSVAFDHRIDVDGRHYRALGMLTVMTHWFAIRFDPNNSNTDGTRSKDINELESERPKEGE